MPLVNPSIVRQHLRVDAVDDAVLIDVYQEAAERSVVEYLDRPVYGAAEDIPAEGEDGFDKYAIAINAALTAAVLLLVGDLYDKRDTEDASSAAVMPGPVRALLAPWRVWRAAEDELGA